MENKVSKQKPMLVVQHETRNLLRIRAAETGVTLQNVTEKVIHAGLDATRSAVGVKNDGNPSSR
jgi:hypothetical protein